MNRNEEFYSCKVELEEMTPDLTALSAARAIKRIKKHHRRFLLLKAPAFSLITAAAAFVLVVNLFPTAAMAMSKVPFLEDLVAAVAFDPSLKIAVENDYVQLVNEKQTKDDTSVTVKYMILDASRISLFFQVDAPVKAGQYKYDFRDENGKPLSAGIVYDTMYESDKLEKIDIEFTDGSEIPKELVFQATVTVDPNFHTEQTATYNPDTGEYNGPSQSHTGTDYAFLFPLKLDDSFRKNSVSLPINQWLDIKGQRIYLDCLMVYPTQARLYISCDPANSAYLKSLAVTFEDENGNCYNPKTNGVTGTYGTDGLNINSLYYESSYFTKAKHLKLSINGISLLDKDKLYGIVQYEKKTITNLPEGVSVSKMELHDSSLFLTLQAALPKDYSVFPLFDTLYYDITGKEYYFNSISTGTDEVNHVSSYDYRLVDFKDHYYKFRWSYAPLQTLEEPIEIKIN